MKPRWILLLLMLLLSLSGCPSGGGGGGHLVMIGLEPEGSCEEVGPIRVTKGSKREVKAALKQKTASMGGDFVHLQKLQFNPGSANYIATGTAYKCK